MLGTMTLPKPMFHKYEEVESGTATKLEYVHMECTKVRVLGEKKIALCQVPSFNLTDDVKKVTCPMCKKIIKSTKRKRIGVRL